VSCGKVSFSTYLQTPKVRKVSVTDALQEPEGNAWCSFPRFNVVFQLPYSPSLEERRDGGRVSKIFKEMRRS